MKPWLVRTETFCFEGEECLYRDHLGRRVVAEWEGPGAILHLQTELTFQINNLPISDIQIPARINEYLCLTTAEPGRFEIHITNEPENANFNPKTPGTLVMEAGHFEQDETWIEIDNFQIQDASELAERKWLAQNLSRPELLESMFESGKKRIANCASLLNACEFCINLPPNCSSLKICKIYDQFHGRQCARVWFDHQFQGLWYLPRQNRIDRWAIAEFSFSFEATAEPRTATVSLDPSGGTPLWSMSEISVFAHCDES